MNNSTSSHIVGGSLGHVGPRSFGADLNSATCSLLRKVHDE